jgi:hypothetical protein
VRRRAFRGSSQAQVKESIPFLACFLHSKALWKTGPDVGNPLVISTENKRPERVCGADAFAVVTAIGHLRGEAAIYLRASTAATSPRIIR